MIDIVARQKYAQQQREKTLASAMKDSIVSGFKQSASSGDNAEVLKLVVKREEEQKLLEGVGKLGDALAMIYKAIMRPIVLPKLFQIRGEVDVKRQPPVKVENLADLKKYFDSLENTFNKFYLAIQAMPQPQIKLPKIEIPAQVRNENPELLKLLENLNDKIDNLQPQQISIPKQIEVSNFPQQYIPTPVTNFNLNSLRGIAETTNVAVGTTATALPATAVKNRRSLIIFNNDSSATLYIGGSDVTAGNGLPVLAQTFSPAIDAGILMTIYGIAATGSINARVMEISNDAIGS